MRPGLRHATLLSVLLVASSASAQDVAPDKAALATELFNAGRDLMNKGDFAAACPKLAESARLDTKVGTLGKLAECEEKTGRLVSARARWQQALNVARAQNDPRVDRVTEELERIDKIVPKLNITVGGTAPPDLALSIDSLQVSSASLGVPIPVEPGHHTVTASASGRVSYSKPVDTAADGAITEVAIPELPAQAAEAPPPPPPPTAEAPAKKARGAPFGTVGLVAAGAGVISAGVATVFAIQASSKNSDSNKNGCQGDSCTPAAAALRNDARSAGDLATIFAIVGGVLIAGGGALWLLSPAPAAGASPSASARLVPSVGPQSGALTLKGSF